MEKDEDWLSEEIENAGKDVRSSVNEAPQSCLPIVEHWGLDPLLMVHVKLFIGDVLSLPSWPGCTEPFNLNGHPVTRVEVMGVIVEALPRQRHLSIHVDDGTGCIQCSFYSESAGEDAAAMQVGCLVSVQGKLHQFNQRRSIAIFRTSVEEDPNAETHHALEVLRLKHTVYQQPSSVSAFLKPGGC